MDPFVFFQWTTENIKLVGPYFRSPELTLAEFLIPISWGLIQETTVLTHHQDTPVSFTQTPKQMRQSDLGLAEPCLAIHPKL